MTKVLSHQQMAHLAREGWLAGIPILSEEEVRHYRASLEAFETKHPEHVKKLKSKSQLLCPWVVDLARTPRLVDLYEDLVGPNILLRNMAWRVKKPDGVTFAGWHQDNIYGANIAPAAITGALALSHCTPETGCLRIIPRSHKWGALPHEDYDDPTSILARGQQIARDFDKSEIVDLVLKPGEIALFDRGIIHGSAPNTGSDKRIFVLTSYIATHAVNEDGLRESAMLIRGRDDHHHFDEEPVPEIECSEEAKEAWRVAVGHRARHIFRNSKLSPSEAYGGERPAA